MPRPTIDDDLLDRLTEVVDERTKVPAEHLGVAERLAFVLDELDAADQRVEHLGDRVEDLTKQLDEAREQSEDRGVSTAGNLGVNLTSKRGGRHDTY